MSMISNVQKINDLRLSHGHKNGRAYKAKAIVTYGNMIVALLDSGSIWTNWETMRRNCLMPGNWGERQVQFFRCLVKLGLVSRDEVEQHMVYVKKHHANHVIRCEQADLNRLAKKYGFTAPVITEPVKPV